MNYIYITYFVAFIAAAYGWVENIIKLVDLFQAHTAPVDAMVIARVIGIPFGLLGAVLGYL